MQRKLIVLLPLLALTAACTTVQVVRPDASKYQIKSACIERNAKVQVSDFTTVLQAGFLRHGIETSLFEQGKIPATCQTVIKYTATRGWDVTPFMNHAEVTMSQEGRVIGTATYRHAGGLALNKWADTATKMDPVIDQLLAGYQ